MRMTITQAATIHVSYRAIAGKLQVFTVLGPPRWYQKGFSNGGVFDPQSYFCNAVVLACGGTVYILHPFAKSNAEHAIQGYGSCIQNQQAGFSHSNTR